MNPVNLYNSEPVFEEINMSLNWSAPDSADNKLPSDSAMLEVSGKKSDSTSSTSDDEDKDMRDQRMRQDERINQGTKREPYES